MLYILVVSTYCILSDNVGHRQKRCAEQFRVAHGYKFTDAVEEAGVSEAGVSEAEVSAAQRGAIPDNQTTGKRPCPVLY